MNKEEIVKVLMDTEKKCGLVETLYRVFGKNIKVYIGLSKSACDASIEELVLSVRSYNALRRANISLIGDLIELLNEGGLKSVRNLGVKSFREIQTKILVFCFEKLSVREKNAFFERLVENNTFNIYGGINYANNGRNAQIY